MYAIRSSGNQTMYYPFTESNISLYIKLYEKFLEADESGRM